MCGGTENVDALYGIEPLIFGENAFRAFTGDVCKPTYIIPLEVGIAKKDDILSILLFR